MKKSRTFTVESLGCAKNQVDSENIIAVLESHGWQFASDPDEAAVIIVNTCSFIGPAREEAIDTTLGLKHAYHDKTVVMAGCLVQMHAEDLLNGLPEVDGFLGNRDPHAIVEVLNDVFAGNRSVRGTRRGSAGHSFTLRNPVLSFPGSAYVKIAEGCSNNCSYCSIPLIRGPLRSRERGEVLREIRSLLEKGIREINLIAQDTSSYGSDRGRAELPELLKDISRIDDEGFWLRLLYLHPEHLNDGILDVVETDRRFLRYFDIPFQHASARILKAMGRNTDSERYLALIDNIRGRFPEAVIRSTFLVGFPGESSADFRELVEFQERAKLDWLGVFVFSREEGTAAARMDGHVPSRVAEHRKNEIERRQVPITELRMERFVGRRLDVLVEERVSNESLSIARGYLHAPEVDGSVVVRGDAHKPGDLVPVTVVRRNGLDLEAVG